jgi:hypothetical protein
VDLGCTSVLRTALVFAMAAMTMVKDMEQGTGKDEQIRKIAEGVQAVLRDEKKSADQQKTDQHDPCLGAPEACRLRNVSPMFAV